MDWFEFFYGFIANGEILKNGIKRQRHDLWKTPQAEFEEVVCDPVAKPSELWQ